MNNSIRPYLYDATKLIKSNVSLLLIPTVIAFAPYLFLVISNNALISAAHVVSSLILFVFYPLIYGKFIAIINKNRNITWSQLFTLHWLNFFIVALLLSIPSLFLTLFNILFKWDINSIEETISALIDMLSIYIFPIVFITYKRLPSIPLGIKCLLGNFTFSLPIIILSIVPLIVELFLSNSFMYSDNYLYYYFFALPQWIFALLIDFTVFITASLILKDRLYRI